jgi:hypothetical protein
LAPNLCERIEKKRMEKNSILSLKLAPNHHERMEKNCERMEKISILSLTLAPNLRERMEKNRERMGKKFHPLTGIGTKIVRGWKCLDLSCM